MTLDELGQQIKRLEEKIDAGEKDACWLMDRASANNPQIQRSVRELQSKLQARQ